MRPIEHHDEEQLPKQHPASQIQPQQIQPSQKHQSLPIKKNFPKDMIIQGFDDEDDDGEMKKENFNSNQSPFVSHSTIKVHGEDVVSVIESAKPHFSYVRDM